MACRRAEFLAQPVGRPAGESSEWTAPQARIVARWYSVDHPGGVYTVGPLGYAPDEQEKQAAAEWCTAEAGIVH
jgi:hypothetical protein